MREILVSRTRIGGWFHIVKDGDRAHKGGRGRYFGVCVVLMEKGWSVHRLTRGDTIQESGPSQKADGRQDWRSRELLQHSTAKQALKCG